jgi:sialidase-1
LSAAKLRAADEDPATPLLEKIDLFKSGDLDYKTYHIPGIAVTAKGTVLAWGEARRQEGDWAAIDILLRRSTDDGKTWSEPQKISDVPGPKTKNPIAMQRAKVTSGEPTYNNPVLIPDRDGTVHALFCLEYMRAFYMRSNDDGVTWSRPNEITPTFEVFRAAYDWKVLATGPNHGIQLQNGRLVVPVWLSTGTGGNAHRPSIVATIYSEDQGATWQPGEIAVPNTSTWINPNESTAIELADGSVMLNTRSESREHRRLVTISKDGKSGWREPRFDQALVEPICMGSLVRYSLSPPADKNRILFSNPDNLTRADGKETPGQPRNRKNLTVQLSYDEGKTWAIKKPVEVGWSAYSDIAVSPRGTILCFYGRTAAKEYFASDRLTVARFNLAWLTDGKDVPTGK